MWPLPDRLVQVGTLEVGDDNRALGDVVAGDAEGRVESEARRSPPAVRSPHLRESPAGPRGAVWQGQGHDGPQAQHLRDGGVEQGQPCAVLVGDLGARGPGAQLTVQLLLQSPLDLGNGEA